MSLIYFISVFINPNVLILFLKDSLVKDSILRNL